MDILILAAIAGFIIYKLYSVLGQEVGFNPQEFSQNPGAQGPAPVKTATRVLVAEGLTTKIEALQQLDPTFDPDEFLDGASYAFKMILQAFNEGDRETLRNLLQGDLYKVFDKVITDRDKKKETWDNELIRIQSAEMMSVEIKKDTDAFVEVKFVSDQILATMNKSGEIIDGDSEQIEILTDIWTFTREVHSTDPNWFLCKTAPGDAK